MFSSALLVEATSPDKWIVRAVLIWATEKETIEVPVGFETDLASIPDMFRGVPGFSTTGASRRPAVLHDWLYYSGVRPRMEADALFYRALLAEGVREPIARIFYRAVRLGGGSAWDAHRRRR